MGEGEEIWAWSKPLLNPEMQFVLLLYYKQVGLYDIYAGHK